MQQCQDVMTREPVCCMPIDSVSWAAHLMKIHNVGSIPVVDNHESRRLLGIITDRDLALKVVAEGQEPRVTYVEDVMTTDPVTCFPGENLNLALERMAEHQVRRLPVVNGEGSIVGIIAQADVALQNENERKTAEVVEKISLPNPEKEADNLPTREGERYE